MRSTDTVSRKRAELERHRSGLRGRDVPLSELAVALHDRFRKECKIDDLDEAITLHRAALELRPRGNKKRFISLSKLAICLTDRYENQGVVADLEEALRLGREVLELHPLGHPNHDASLNNLACDLRTRFGKEADIRDLEEAIQLHRAALVLRPSDHPYRSSSLQSLAHCLTDRYGDLGVAADLEEAVMLGRAALELRPPGHPNRGASLNGLAHSLRMRFEKEADIRNLEEAIQLHHAALELRPSGHAHRSSSLQNLARCLSDRYSILGVGADLEEAVMLGRTALELRPPGHPNRSATLNVLACSLRMRFEKQADMCDLEEAIRLHRVALELRPPMHPHQFSSLHNLALCLSLRYSNLRVAADLEEAVKLGRAALELRPPGHPNRSATLIGLACSLRMRFEKQADMHDLQEAIEQHRAALELRPSGGPYQFSSLQNFALCLSYRYGNLGVVADLEEAVSLGRAALEFCPPWHSDRGASLHNLSCNLRRRFQKLADMRDLEEAIGLQRAALELRPPGHPDRFSSLNNLALCLSDRYDAQGVVDFREATTVSPTAPTLRPPGHSDRGTPDLDEAITLEQEALTVLEPGDRYYDTLRQRLTAHLQMKIRSQVATPSSNASPATHIDIKQVIRGVAFEILKTLPTRVLHTGTGILCNRDAQLSNFLSSQQYNQLLSSCATCDPAQQTRLIHTEVSRYFRFVTLSHRWGSGEPLLRDIEGRSIYVISTNGGFGKLQAFCAIAGEQDYLWAWSDTCCIDKDSSAELQEAIGSMFVWYRRSTLTITYLSDVSDTNSFLSSEWFKRGWTLQELLAPERLLFYTQTWSLYKNLRSSNHKTDVAVLEELGRATGIESRFLTNFSPGMDDARSRLQWASLRRTTRPEDIAYSLFGIFDIHLPVLYGESAEIALGRLLAEIISQSGDISVLDWVGEASRFHSCFPAEISPYQTPPMLPSPQPNTEEHTPIISEQLVASLQTLYRSLDKLPLPRFVNRRLTLPCITYLVTAVQLKGTAPYDSSCTYEIQASGLRPFQVALPSKLENQIMSPGVLHVVRPWHSKLLDPYGKVSARIDKQLFYALGKPFHALLLIELPHNEYKRIASSTPIIAQPVNEDSILKSGVKTLDIV